MLFSVIYTFDCEKEQSVKPFQPPKHRTLWKLTECDDNNNEGMSCYGLSKHRKYCALLTREQFDEFIDWTALVAEDVETMGSLGAPGCGFGLSPAISFNGNDDNGVWQNAYVTPLPERELKNKELDHDDWRRIRRAILSVYG